MTTSDGRALVHGFFGGLAPRTKWTLLALLLAILGGVFYLVSSDNSRAALSWGRPAGNGAGWLRQPESGGAASSQVLYSIWKSDSASKISQTTWRDSDGNTYRWVLDPSQSGVVAWANGTKAHRPRDDLVYSKKMPLVFCNLDQATHYLSKFAIIRGLEAFDAPIRTSNAAKNRLFDRSGRQPKKRKNGIRRSQTSQNSDNNTNYATPTADWDAQRWREHALWQRRHPWVALQDSVLQMERTVTSLRSVLHPKFSTNTSNSSDYISPMDDLQDTGLLWPYSAVFPEPAFIRVGDFASEVRDLEHDFLSKNTAKIHKKMRKIYGNDECVERMVDEIEPPVWGWFGSVGSNAFASRASGESTDRHSDSRTNTKTSHQPWVSPLFTFFIDEESIAVLGAHELQSLYSGVVDACSDLALASHGNRFSAFIRDSFSTTDAFTSVYSQYSYAGKDYELFEEPSSCPQHAGWGEKLGEQSVGHSVLSSLTISITQSDTAAKYSLPHGKASQHVDSNGCKDADVQAAVAQMVTSLQQLSPSQLYHNLTNVPLGQNCNMFSNIAIPHAQMDERYTVSLETSATGPGGLADMGASLKASTVWGALRSLQTFQQLISPFGFRSAFGSDSLPVAVHPAELEVPVPDARPSYSDSGQHTCNLVLTAPPPITLPIFIADKPLKRWRGMSLDTARHYIPVEKILQLLEGMKLVKFNVLHWHLADAQSFPVELASLPDIAQRGKFGDNKTYTFEDMQLIVAYAALRGIRVVPEVDAPAHARGMSLAAPPGVLVRCDAIAGASLHDYDKYALNPASEQTLPWYATILAELSLLFPDRSMHIGADEVFAACWDSDPSLSQWTKKHLPNLMQAMDGMWGQHSHEYLSLLAYWLHNVHKVGNMLGKELVAWEDSHAMMASVDDRRRVSYQRGPSLHFNRTEGKDSDFDPTSSIVRYAFPVETAIQGWKCWEQHADGTLSRAGADWDSQNNHTARRKVLQSACWYLDYSVPWTDMYRHWSLPESSSYMSSILSDDPGAVCLDKYGKVYSDMYDLPLAMVHDSNPGGEVAMWTERVDVTNLECRVWPRAAAAAEVLWSQSVSFLRYKESKRRSGNRVRRLSTPTLLTSDPEFDNGFETGRSRNGTLPSPNMKRPQRQDRLLSDGARWANQVTTLEAMSSLLKFAAPRMVSVVGQLWRQNIASSPLAVIDMSKLLLEEGKIDPSIEHIRNRLVDLVPRPPNLKLDFNAETTEFPSNGWCPGVEQEIQRQVLRFAPSRAELLHLRFIVWNIDNGGESDRISRIMAHLRESKADVVAIVEASGWTHKAPAASALRELETIAQNTNVSRNYRKANVQQSWNFQTMDLRRRAASAGFPYAHLLHVPSGYHIVLMSVRPITVILEDMHHFSRGLLVADTGGYRFMIAHLHAQEPEQRLTEAKWISFLAEQYSNSGVPVVIAGDFNTLSHLDAHCHEQTDLLGFLKDARTPDYLRHKFLTPSGKIDYCPFTALLGAHDDNINTRQLSALTDGCRDVEFTPKLIDATSQRNVENIPCAGTIPTEFHNDPLPEGLTMPPMDIDHVMLNPVAVEIFEASHVPHACVIDNSQATQRLSDHFPLVCDFRQLD